MEAVGVAVRMCPKGGRKCAITSKNIMSRRKVRRCLPPIKYDPDEYLHAKKRLKKAVLECYR